MFASPLQHIVHGCECELVVGGDNPAVHQTRLEQTWILREQRRGEDDQATSKSGQTCTTEGSRSSSTYTPTTVRLQMMLLCTCWLSACERSMPRFSNRILPHMKRRPKLLDQSLQMRRRVGLKLALFALLLTTAMFRIISIRSCWVLGLIHIAGQASCDCEGENKTNLPSRALRQYAQPAWTHSPHCTACLHPDLQVVLHQPALLAVLGH